VREELRACEFCFTVNTFPLHLPVFQFFIFPPLWNFHPQTIGFLSQEIKPTHQNTNNHQ
jgi:hypothetical protein